MKLKHISALFFLLFAFSLVGISQVEDGEVRSLGQKKMHDFGTIKDVSAEYTIVIKNKGKTDLKIGKVLIPQGVGVTVIKDVLKPGEKGGLVITINPKYVESGNFKKELIYSTITVTASGTKVTKTAKYDLKGQVL